MYNVLFQPGEKIGISDECSDSTVVVRQLPVALLQTAV